MFLTPLYPNLLIAVEQNISIDIFNKYRNVYTTPLYTLYQINVSMTDHQWPIHYLALKLEVK